MVILRELKVNKTNTVWAQITSEDKWRPVHSNYILTTPHSIGRNQQVVKRNDLGMLTNWELQALWYVRIHNHTSINAWDKIIYPFPNVNSLSAKVWEGKNTFIPNFIMDVITYSIIMLMKFSDLSQSDHSNWVMWQVNDPCPRPGWDGCLTREKWLS